MFSFHSKCNGNLLVVPSLFHSFFCLSIGTTWPLLEIVCWMKRSGTHFVTISTATALASIFFFGSIHFSSQYFTCTFMRHLHLSTIVTLCDVRIICCKKRWNIPVRNDSWLLGSQFQFYQFHFSCIIVRYIQSDVFDICLTLFLFFRALSFSFTFRTIEWVPSLEGTHGR